ncbi:hypothetical protein AOQ84DRAFT_352015 [Glonium stellatum]|uniref:Uncharacterized protein n=1 Tax=Glonium stellatum TaxID=574774 RepID=A0A8E2FA27_9PEZI|nr:hypothetical protein AOQ84DRAFT_352015 [Glonium stellatum]
MVILRCNIHFTTSYYITLLFTPSAYIFMSHLTHHIPPLVLASNQHSVGLVHQAAILFS